MRKLFTLIAIFTTLQTNAQSLYFPPLSGSIWETTSSASLGWCDNKIDDLSTYLAAKNTKAFILLKDGKIVIEKYYGTFTQDSLWYWASAGKSLTAFLVGMAQQENLLKISDTSSKYLGSGWSNCTPQQEQKITIKHQLTMTTGLDDGVPDHYCTLATCLNYLSDPGTRWAYHNGPYTLLDKVLESATGKSVNTYLYQKLTLKTGISGLFYASGYNNVFASKARSMARYGLLVLNKGNWDGTPILTDANYFNDMTNSSQNLNPSYGYLWWLNGKSSYMAPGYQFDFPGSICPNGPSDLIMALGKNGQMINVVPSQNLVYIRIGDAPGVGEVPFLFNDTIWQKINAFPCPNSAQEISFDFKMYPNPANTLVNIVLANTKFNVEICDLTGRFISSHNNCFGEQSISLEGLPKGIYDVKIMKSSGSVAHQKLSIQ